jgi:inner membrane transporter RhtA
VTTVRSHTRRALAWRALALVGVMLFTEPRKGDHDVVVLLFAALAAPGWALYHLTTQLLRDRFSRLSGLSMTVPVAAVTAAVAGAVPQAEGHPTLQGVAPRPGLPCSCPSCPMPSN